MTNLIRIASNIVERTSIKRMDPITRSHDTQEAEELLGELEEAKQANMYKSLPEYEGTEVHLIKGKYPKYVFMKDTEVLGELDIKEKDGFIRISFIRSFSPGFGMKMYQYALSQGYPLMSDGIQTPDSEKAWVKLFRDHAYDVYAWDLSKKQRFEVREEDGRLGVPEKDLYALEGNNLRLVAKKR